jgi:putative MATE family efflux protein
LEEIPLKDLTKGSINKNLILFAIPLLMGSLLNTGYNIIDTMYLGRVSADAVAAVTMSFSVIIVLLSLAMGLTMGTSTLVSQYYGAKRMDMVNKVIVNSIVFIAIVSGTLSIIGIALSEKILMLMGAPEHLLYDGVMYLRIILAGIILMFAYFVVAAILRGLGDTVTPLKFMAVSSITNIILDPLFIFGYGPFPRMGVSGAAVATVLAQGLAALMGLYFMVYKSKDVKLSFKDFRMDFSIIKDIIRLGIPAGIAQTMTALGGAILIAIVTAQGSLAVAAYGIGMRVDSLAMMIGQSLGMGAAAMVGQSIGANDRDRAIKTIYSASLQVLAILAFVTLLIQLFPITIMKAFTTDQSVYDIGISYLKLVSLIYPLFGVMLVLSAAFRGAGDAFIPMIITALTFWVIRIPIATFLAARMGPVGVWWAIVMSNIVSTGASIIYFYSMRWLKKGVVKEKLVEELV